MHLHVISRSREIATSSPHFLSKWLHSTGSSLYTAAFPEAGWLERARIQKVGNLEFTQHFFYSSILREFPFLLSTSLLYYQPAPTEVKQLQPFTTAEITANCLPMKYVNSSQPQPEKFSEAKNSLSTGYN